MGEHIDFWQSTAPYWSYYEDNFLDLDSIRGLLPEIAAPVLVVGAGQGLLVEELQNNALEVDGVDTAPYMIEYAKERRNVDVIQADGKRLPFGDGAYATSIIATGVIDFMDDEAQIASIMSEVFRVTDEAGGVLVAFYRFHSKVEELCTFLRLIHPDGILNYRDTMKFFYLRPLALISAVSRMANVGFFKALMTMVKVQLLLPKKEKEAAKNMKKVFRLAERDLGSIDKYFDSAPERLPYRDEKKIRTLFSDIGIRIEKFINFDTCCVVKLLPNQQGT